LVELVDLAV